MLGIIQFYIDPSQISHAFGKTYMIDAYEIPKRSKLPKCVESPVVCACKSLTEYCNFYQRYFFQMHAQMCLQLFQSEIYRCEILYAFRQTALDNACENAERYVQRKWVNIHSVYFKM